VFNATVSDILVRY